METPLELSYESIDAVPEAFRGLYTEGDEGVSLTGVNGLKTQDDIDRLNTALGKERTDHKAAKQRVAQFDSFLNGRELDEIQTTLDEIDELKARLEAGEGKGIDDEAIQQLVETKTKRALAPVERQLNQATEQLATVTAERDAANEQIRRYTIGDAIRSVAVESKMHSTAVEDCIDLGLRMMEITEDGQVLTRDEVGVTPGVDTKTWLSEMQQKRPHWWPTSQGGGATGGKGGAVAGVNNPWTREGWNLTEQGRIYRDNAQQADMLAKAAGHSKALGAQRPPAKKAS